LPSEEVSLVLGDVDGGDAEGVEAERARLARQRVFGRIEID
jgi:hypothetical protein